MKPTDTTRSNELVAARQELKVAWGERNELLQRYQDRTAEAIRLRGDIAMADKALELCVKRAERAEDQLRREREARETTVNQRDRAEEAPDGLACALFTVKEIGEQARILLPDSQAEVAELREQLRQEREARADSGDGSCDHCGAVPSINIPTSLCDECRDGIARAEKAEAEVAQLQTTVGQLSRFVKHTELCLTRKGGDVCTCGLDAALAICPAPEAKIPREGK